MAILAASISSGIPPRSEFARRYGLALKACQGGDAARKGKIERPFRDLKAGFLAEMDLDPPADIGELNRRAEAWLARYAQAVVHRTTKVTPDARFRIEQPLARHVPRVRFDTARREPRRVGRVPMIEWDGIFYSVPPDVVGQMVETRQPVVGDVVEIRFVGRLVATHRRAPAGPNRSGCPSTAPPPKRSPSAVTAATCVPSPTTSSRSRLRSSSLTSVTATTTSTPPISTSSS
ncbi:MAG: hypothetical protein WKF58_00815 [Ilumatobacteraceae bacterium]